MTPVDQLLDVAIVNQDGNKEDEVVNHVRIPNKPNNPTGVSEIEFTYHMEGKKKRYAIRNEGAEKRKGKDKRT